MSKATRVEGNLVLVATSGLWTEGASLFANQNCETLGLPVGGGVDAILTAFARLRPDDAVILGTDETLSREELDRRADGFAAILVDSGLAASETVAVCLPRSVGQVVASLGVLKAGGACLGLSPDAPLELLRFRLADCGITRIVVEDRNGPIAGLAAGAHAMTYDWRSDGAVAPHWPGPPGCGRDAVACVVPVDRPGGPTCGAEITHANLLFIADWLRADFDLGMADRVCHMADAGSSAAMLELWPALACGATIVVMDDAVAADAMVMRDWLRRNRISVMLAAEDAAEALALPGWNEDDALRLVMAECDGATAITGRHAFRVVATYGHDECALITTARQVPANDRFGGPNLGRPIAGASVHILDGAGEPVATGAEGNVWIGGRGVGRGYRNRPDLTADRFVPDPFGDDPGGMIFRTGGRGRRLIGGGVGRCEAVSLGAY
ncbi:AMP-binding protein [Sphingomonas sp. M6A6_1c]